MLYHPNGAERLNAFALVMYIPDPLGSYLNALRQELVPDCNVCSHVTILPPRPLSSKQETAWRCIREAAQRTPAFQIQLTRVEIFPVTSVIYLAIGAGQNELRKMHEEMNQDGLAFQEPYRYHPHITLAQEIPPAQLSEAYELACRRWKEFQHERSFKLDHVTFVQNTISNHWIDLREVSLGQPYSAVC